MYLLSYTEANKYFNVTYDDRNNTKSRVDPTAYAIAQGVYTSSSNNTADGKAAGWWWLRSPAAIRTMPTISMFYGITIRMYNNNEHNPPYFHALYQGYKAAIDMEGNVIEGSMPGKQLKLIQAWVVIHHDELLANWELAIDEEPLYKIEPLK